MPGLPILPNPVQRTTPTKTYKPIEISSVPKDTTTWNQAAMVNNAYKNTFVGLNQSFPQDTAPSAPENPVVDYKENQTYLNNANKGVNVLNNYNIYTPIFTLAALKREALSDDYYLTNSTQYFTIAKSGGKNGIAFKNFTPDNIVNQFNKNSPGKFDFFIDNVRINTVCGGNNITNMAIATKIEFDLVEPYSMTGFIETLYTAAIAFDHDSYANCPFLFKVEFVGYNDTTKKLEKVPNTERHFVFAITQVEMDVNEGGARYKVSGVPYNDRVSSGVETGKLIDNVKASGETVKDILNSLMNNINISVLDATKKINPEATAAITNTYEVVFPQNDNIANSKLGEYLKTFQNFEFPETDVTMVPSQPGAAIDPKNPTFQFGKNLDIVDVITAIVRDSDYVRNIIAQASPDANNPNKTLKTDPYGYIDYFKILTEAVDTGVYDEYTNKPVYKFRYLLVPYKLHYSRLQPLTAETVSKDQLEKTALRKYNYIYTGKNVDILNFRLNFNTLFFQALPKDFGTKEGYSDLPNVSESDQPNRTIAKPTSKKDVQKKINGVPAKKTPVERTVSSNIDGMQSAALPQIDSYYEIARNMHQSIIDNVDQSTAEIEIIGDPFYLGCNNTGNQRIDFSYDNKTLKNGEMPFIYQDVHILINFLTPLDIDLKTGTYSSETITQVVTDETTGEKTSKELSVAFFSGVFRVIEVDHTFNEGVYKTNLKLVRIPNQEYDSSTPPELPTMAETSVVPGSEPIVNDITIDTFRVDENTLASAVMPLLPGTSKLPSLPGSLSNLVPGGLNSLAGAIAGGLTIASVINSLKSGASNNVGALVNNVSGTPVSGLSNLSSALRLANSGLSSLSTDINSNAGYVYQLSNVSQTLGLRNASSRNMSQNLVNNQSVSAASFDQSQLSRIDGLGNHSAGLVSNASANIDSINGKVNSLESQLGIKASALSGLSSNVRTKLLSTILDAANKIPSDVDLNKAASLIKITNLPLSKLSSLPATQPSTVPRTPSISSNDLKYLVSHGANLKNIPGLSNIPNSNNIIGNINSTLNSAGQSNAVVADKLMSIQQGLNKVTNQAMSKESSYLNVSKVSSNPISNVGDLSKTSINKYGSKSSPGPLTALINYGYGGS